MKKLLAAARGDVPCDLLIRGGRIANTLSLEFEDADVAITDGVIVGVGQGYTGTTEVDASGCILIPGMIDGHLHIESTMLSPAMFAAAVLPLGTTTVMPDPHEIANTCGTSGIEYMWRDSLRTPLDIYFAAPSCVPASPFETPREELDAASMIETCERGWTTHLGEMMNFPGVIGGDDAVWSKITAARHLVRTAHLPNVSGRDLCAYLLSGCDGDHESNFPGEALEKLRRGVWLMLREGATEHNLRETAQVILDDEARHARCMAVSDDLTAAYILEHGHMDHKLRLMIGAGIRPLVALALVTINPANYFRLYDRGAIAPGRIADIALVDSLEACNVQKVWKRGKLVAEGGKPRFTMTTSTNADLPEFNVQTVKTTPDAYRVEAVPGKNIRVIGALQGTVLSETVIAAPKVEAGFVVSDTDCDIVKMVVVEKNRGTGRTAIGFVKGFGIKRGAIASSVAHDAHNFVAIGVDDESIATAMNALFENRGGLVTALGDKVTASLPLPIGGLMSDLDAPALSRELIHILASAKELGTSIPQPFMTMSFLSLSVIPELKLTDRGYVNLAEGGIVGLFV